MSSIRPTLLIVAATIGMAAMLTAFAHEAGCRDSGSHRRDPGAWAEHMKQRQTALHDALKLRPDQEAAWSNFIANTTPKELPLREDWKALAELPAPERMSKMLDRMKQHETELAARIPVVTEFYAKLSPEQQKIFNEQFGWHHRRGHGHADGRAIP
ncbi:MAG: Spy/CpxP family protein refolding chaperone [Gammaproteobacteria bacterium]|nr:Spy/CpxP family protein refolding chaperone [Gammaproteobacteria bacterium]MBI5614982.1 Spy/CpxP family protein refolding chaperone [Gammaproteobacteria bacterium]